MLWRKPPEAFFVAISLAAYRMISLDSEAGASLTHFSIYVTSSIWHWTRHTEVVNGRGGVEKKVGLYESQQN